MIRNKRILVTGAAGSVGSELCRQLYKTNKLYGIDISENGLFEVMNELSIPGRYGDIRDEKTVRDVFSDFKPEIVFHAAACKHVPLMEDVPLEAIRTNILGTYNLIDYANRWECVKKFVFISSDKAVNPHSVMGASKRMGEIMVKNSGKGFVVVRFGNVLGSRGSVIPIWQKQFNEGKSLTVTDGRMERFFMTIEEAVGLVIEAAEIGEGGEIIVLDMGQRVNVLDLAKRIISGARTSTGVELIGIRPGEQLIEKIMLEEEEARAVKKGKLWIIK